MVESLDALDQYPYSGHSAIMGFWKREWQDADTVLGYFGHREKGARRKYREYVEQGVECNQWGQVSTLDITLIV
jgi:hypothetical protein